MANALLEIHDLHKSFGPVEVLKGVDCSMHQGEVISIIGSSGSGKTTMLRCINMLEEFQGGSISIDGEPVGYETVGGVRRRKREKDIARQRAMTGMAFQQFNLFPHMTAANNVMLGLMKVKKMERAEARSVAEKWLDRVGLAARMDHFPGQLSGGQQQRVAIARAIAMNPSLAQDGMSMLLVTHEMRFAYEVSARVIFMNQGRIGEQGDPKAMFVKPQTERLAEFLKTSTFN